MLERFFDHDTKREHLRASLDHDVGQRIERLTGRQEIVDDDDAFLWVQVLRRYEQQRLAALGARRHMALKRVLGHRDGAHLAREDDRNVERDTGLQRGRNAADFGGQNLVRFEACEATRELLADSLHEAGVDLVVKERVNLQDVALQNLAVPQYSIL